MTTTPHAELLTYAEVNSALMSVTGGKQVHIDIMKFAREIERALLARLGEQQPVAWQYRMSTESWGESWSEWSDCTEQVAKGYLLNPKEGHWRYEVRALYAHPPAAQPAGAYLEGVNVERLQRAMAQAGQGCEVSHEALAAPGLLADHINRLTAAVARNPELAAQPVARGETMSGDAVMRLFHKHTRSGGRGGFKTDWDAMAAELVASTFPEAELGGCHLNESAWKFIEAMPHHLPGPIFNDLKPALKAAVDEYLKRAGLLASRSSAQGAAQVPPAVTQDDAFTLLGYAALMRGEGKHDMPAFFDDLAARIFTTLGDEAGAKRCRDLAAAPHGEGER